MNRVLIIQARMNSTRLPGKVLEDLAGRPMLSQQIRRLRECECIDEIVIATTTSSSDDLLVDLAYKEDVEWYRGSEDDVLSRYVDAAAEADADVVIRVTADCPLIDPGLTDRVITDLIDHSHECDYASNVLDRTYPRGLDVEAFFMDALLRMDRLSYTQASREHVTVVPRAERPELFLLRSIRDGSDNSDLRWTVDAPEDLEMMRAIYEGLGLDDRVAPYAEVLSYVRAHPEISRMNSGNSTWDPR